MELKRDNLILLLLLNWSHFIAGYNFNEYENSTYEKSFFFLLLITTVFLCLHYFTTSLQFYCIIWRIHRNQERMKVPLCGLLEKGIAGWTGLRTCIHLIVFRMNQLYLDIHMCIYIYVSNEWKMRSWSWNKYRRVIWKSLDWGMQKENM